MEKLLEKLHWRYAVKRYDRSKPVSAAQIEMLKKVMQLAPTSFGLQPFRVIIVEDPQTREKLRQASFHQPQITDAAVLLVMAVELTIGESFVDGYFDRVCQTRQQALEGGLRAHRDNVVAAINRKTAAEKQYWATHQAYLVLGFLLLAAAELDIDANAMEGFIPSAYDEILGLKELGLHSVVIAALGVRHAEDHFQRFAKVRKTLQELFIQR